MLDEVTSALDPETEAAIVDNIAGLRGRYTIIAITHRPAWTRIADVQYTFLGGRVTLTAGRTATRDDGQKRSWWKEGYKDMTDLAVRRGARQGGNAGLF